LLFKAPRGTADVLPEEQPYWRYVKEKIEALCDLYGYQRIDTPVFEDVGLFHRSVGEGTDIVEKEMYVFQDKGGAEMTLRPEGTAPACRAYIEHGMHSLPQPVKLYYIAPAFRYERPQAGRLRQHTQFGVEAIGESDPALDAEMISIAWRLYDELGLSGLLLHVNSIGCPVCRPSYIAALKEYFEPKFDQLCRNCKDRYQRNTLRLLDCKEESCQPIIEGAPKSVDFLCEECAGHFESLKKYLGALKIPFNLNTRLVRGLDYYTKTVFEVQPERGGSQSTIGAGGRYDGLIEELGGRPTPATGFATGIERIVLNLKQQEIDIPGMPSPRVAIAYLGEEAKLLAIELAKDLLDAGVGTRLLFGEKSLRSQLRQANTLGAESAVIIGEDELKSATVVLRKMDEGTQMSLPVTEVVAYLTSD